MSKHWRPDPASWVQGPVGRGDRQATLSAGWEMKCRELEGDRETWQGMMKAQARGRIGKDSKVSPQSST